ncbi:MAG: hypothetical protein ORN52_11810 [Beijerinckiaceae bacterium]|nr:hypothetical protein [Beijerinckiaceae bacterium]
MSVESVMSRPFPDDRIADRQTMPEHKLPAQVEETRKVKLLNALRSTVSICALPQ